MKQSDENLVTTSKLGARTFDIDRYFQTKDGRAQLEIIVEIEKLVLIVIVVIPDQLEIFGPNPTVCQFAVRMNIKMRVIKHRSPISRRILSQQGHQTSPRTASHGPYVVMVNNPSNISTPGLPFEAFVKLVLSRRASPLVVQEFSAFQSIAYPATVVPLCLCSIMSAAYVFHIAIAVTMI